MKSCLRIVLLVFLVTGTLTQELDLNDAFGPDPTLEPKAPEPKKPKVPDVPKTDDKSEKKPSSGGGGLDLEDALGPDAPTEKPAPKPPKGGGGGGSFDDSDLIGVGEGDYKPDGGRSGGETSL
ncbi:CD99 molecule [Scomber japonicus]|uniref:CD99 molecule n=1 Tax=Scomber japonicus TaxID=13676 RepID=UPI00230520D7|nr:CD99 molecule [Scomber japonicus]